MEKFKEIKEIDKMQATIGITTRYNENSFKESYEKEDQIKNA